VTGDVEIVWEAPPDPRPRLGMYDAAVREIEQNPGRWARVRVFEKQSTAYSSAGGLRARLVALDPRWQVRSGPLDDGTFGLWVRFRSDGQMKEEKK
jgi:hypothetical protein